MATLPGAPSAVSGEETETFWCVCGQVETPTNKEEDGKRKESEQEKGGAGGAEVMLADGAAGLSR